MILILLFGLFIQDGLALPSDRSLNVGRDSRYSGYKVLAVIPNTKEQVSWLAEFKGNPSLNCSLDWWNEPSLPAVTVSLAVNPSCLEDVIQEFKNEGLSARVRIPDLEKVIALEKNYRFLSQLYRNPDDWNEEVYHNLEEINKRVDSLVKTYSEVLTAKTLATTYEGRKIEVVIVREAGPVNKPVIWIDCGIHAREWISPPTCLHIIDRLIDSVNSVDPKENLLAVYDFYILPVANPDGYAYTWSTDRMWRKNRKPNPGANNLQSPFFGWNGNQNQKCDGSDPNRNFPIHFNEASNNPCDGSFRGETPFSEAEAQAVRNGVQQMLDVYGKNKIAAFITIHANSQLWMSPYGYTKIHSVDHDDQMKVMKKSVDALGKVFGTEYRYGPISEVIYLASGSSVDWAYEGAGIKYSYALELRDTGDWGFLLPQEQIKDTASETWIGITAMAWAIAEEYGVKV